MIPSDFILKPQVDQILHLAREISQQLSAPNFCTEIYVSWVSHPSDFGGPFADDHDGQFLKTLEAFRHRSRYFRVTEGQDEVLGGRTALSVVKFLSCEWTGGGDAFAK